MVGMQYLFSDGTWGIFPYIADRPTLVEMLESEPCPMVATVHAIGAGEQVFLIVRRKSQSE